MGVTEAKRGRGRGRVLRMLACAPAALLLACASSEPTGTLIEVNEFGATIQQVQSDADAANEKVGQVAGRFGTLLHFDFEHDALAAFTEFHQAQGASIEALAKLKDDVEAMKSAAAPFFKKWLADLDRFESTELRLRSQQRLTDTQRRFDAIVATAEAVQHTFASFNSQMRDYAMFLSHDFNEESVASLRGDEARLKDEVGLLLQAFEKCSHSARDYVQSSTLPTASSSAPAPLPDEKTASRNGRGKSGG